MQRNRFLKILLLLVVLTTTESKAFCATQEFVDLINKGRELESEESFLAAEAPYKRAAEFAKTSTKVTRIEKIEAQYRMALVRPLTRAEELYQKCNDSANARAVAKRIQMIKAKPTFKAGVMF